MLALSLFPCLSLLLFFSLSRVHPPRAPAASLGNYVGSSWFYSREEARRSTADRRREKPRRDDSLTYRRNTLEPDAYDLRARERSALTRLLHYRCIDPRVAQPLDTSVAFALRATSRVHLRGSTVGRLVDLSSCPQTQVSRSTALIALRDLSFPYRSRVCNFIF